jgi:hypothetical protein
VPQFELFVAADIREAGVFQGAFAGAPPLQGVCKKRLDKTQQWSVLHS